jgi:uncharacterized protein (TIGR00251 family)
MNVNEAVRKKLNGVLIDVKVVPDADKKDVSFDRWRKRIKLKVKGRALKNEANEDTLDFFSKLFDSKVKIFSGEHSRKKTVFIENINPDDAVRKIEEMMK